MADDGEVANISRFVLFHKQKISVGVPMIPNCGTARTGTEFRKRPVLRKTIPPVPEFNHAIGLRALIARGIRKL